MKYLFCIFVTLIMTNASFALIHTPMSGQISNTGAITRYDKVFVTALNQSGAALTAGRFYQLDTSNDDGMSITTAGGVFGERAHCMAVAATPAGSVGKCQVWGFSSIIAFDLDGGTATAGEQMYMSGAYAGRVLGVATGEIKAYHYPVGTFYDASAASGAIEGFIKLL